MWSLILVVLACASVQGQKTKTIGVESGGPTIQLNADPDDTVYDIVTMPGAKIISICILQLLDCTQTVFLAAADGATWGNACNVSQPVQFIPSIKHKLTFRIKSGFRNSPVKCYLSATKPYIDSHGDEPDTTEHGIHGLGEKEPTCPCGWANKQSGRIVGGKIAKPNEFSFPVRFLVNQQPICGASIITPNTVLTAAHCTYNLPITAALHVVVGEHSIENSPHRQIHQVAYFVQHEQYNPQITLNDISILVLKTNIQYTNIVGPVCMPTGPKQNLVSEHIKIIGWGKTSYGGVQSPVLKKLNLAVLDPDICAVAYPGFGKNGEQICTYRDTEGSCQGDSGGPLVRRSEKTNMFVQVALVSYGRICASTDPTVNSDVRHYMPWIEDVVRKAQSPMPMCYSE